VSCNWITMLLGRRRLLIPGSFFTIKRFCGTFAYDSTKLKQIWDRLNDETHVVWAPGGYRVEARLWLMIG